MTVSTAGELPLKQRNKEEVAARKRRGKRRKRKTSPPHKRPVIHGNGGQILRRGRAISKINRHKIVALLRIH